MATINNTKVFFSITARENDVARRSFRPAGQKGHRMNGYHPENSTGESEVLALQMAVYTIQQILAMKDEGHYMMTLPEDAAIKFFTAKKAVKNGVPFAEAFGFIENRSEAFKKACQSVYDVMAELDEAEGVYDIQFIQRHRLTSWNVEALGPDANLEEGMKLNFVDGIDEANGVRAEINVLNGEFEVSTYQKLVRDESGDIVPKTFYRVDRKGTIPAMNVIRKENAGEELTADDHRIRASRYYAQLKTDMLARADVPEMLELEDDEFDAVAGDEF